jgi:predicted ATP-grasp superfamily ATP-dependent carboligase
MSDAVLVLDGAQRSALATVRSLGRRGVPVFTGDSGDECLAGRSRYCLGHSPLPSPLVSAERYVTATAEAALRLGVSTILPMTDASTMLLLGGIKDSVFPRSVRIGAPPSTAYETVSDKGSLVDLAGKIGVPVPPTRLVRTRHELDTAVSELGFPCVLKPSRSRYHDGDQVISTSVSIIRRPSEIASNHNAELVGKMPILVQEFIPGHGAGIFTLYGPDGAVAWFAHRRLREKPPSGGVSVLCESVAVDPAMQHYAALLLAEVRWFGPAMIEFRVDAEGRPWLMEINGRFWGSLQLAIDSGVDFPWLLYQLCHDVPLRTVDHYEVGRRLRWLLGDLDHLLLQLRGKGTANTVHAKLQALGGFFNFFGKSHFEVLRSDDMAPFRHEVREWLRGLR